MNQDLSFQWRGRRKRFHISVSNKINWDLYFNFCSLSELEVPTLFDDRYRVLRVYLASFVSDRDANRPKWQTAEAYWTSPKYWLCTTWPNVRRDWSGTWNRVDKIFSLDIFALSGFSTIIFIHHLCTTFRNQLVAS